jgi:hypothetical protein
MSRCRWPPRFGASLADWHRHSCRCCPRAEEGEGRRAQAGRRAAWGTHGPWAWRKPEPAPFHGSLFSTIDRGRLAAGAPLVRNPLGLLLFGARSRCFQALRARGESASHRSDAVPARAVVAEAPEA